VGEVDCALAQAGEGAICLRSNDSGENRISFFIASPHPRKLALAFPSPTRGRGDLKKGLENIPIKD